MSASKKRYDGEFKREAVRLADNCQKGDSTIERELGLYQGAIRTVSLQNMLDHFSPLAKRWFSR